MRFYISYDHTNGTHAGYHMFSNSLQTGEYTFTYTPLSNTGNIRIHLDKDNTNTSTETQFYVDYITFTKGKLEIIEESNYYPFGLKHRGYNTITTAFGNSVAQKYKYNGVEFEESLGLNLYEMDFRMYDPAIGRFNGIDPVTHHSQGTSVAFDNNPIYFADPSGADAIYNDETGEYVINGVVVSFLEALAYAENGGNADGSNDNTPNEDHITNISKLEMETIASDLNSIYGKKYGKTPFSVEIQTRTRKVKVKNVSWFNEDEYKEIEYEVYVLKGSIGFDWNTDKYTKMLHAIMTSSEDIKVDIVQNNGKLYKSLTKLTLKGLLEDYGGGKVINSNHIIISSSLSLESSKTGNWTIGGVTLHELLTHISPDVNPNENINILRSFYGLKTGKDHPVGNNQNKKIRRINQ